MLKPRGKGAIVDHGQYVFLLAACAVVTVPLELVGCGVYRRPRRLLSVLAPIAVFMVWDAIAIARGDWWFTSAYVTGWRLPFAIPLEEAAFFIVIPLCTLLTYEAVRRIATTRRHDA